MPGNCDKNFRFFSVLVRLLAAMAGRADQGGPVLRPAKPAPCAACGLLAFIYILLRPAALSACGLLCPRPTLLEPGRTWRVQDGPKKNGIPQKNGGRSPQSIVIGIVQSIQARRRKVHSATESCQRIGRHTPSFRTSRLTWPR